MAFSHIVTFKWKTDDFDDAPIASALKALIPHLDGVRDYRCGADVGLTPSSDDFAVVGVFDGRDSFTAYREHPEHQRILNEMIVPNLDRRTVVQLED
ncbi:stress responsive alpha/beta barrel protein [Mycobacterium sp. BK558]|nr:Dabb family protein [Mycolicibacterium rufum]RZT19106.1 stress responsive alpha/beta barrel protein [Mycobacterium sp. BK558]